MRFLRILLAWLILFAEPCAAATKYVSWDTGSDAADGSIGTPWKTINKANTTIDTATVVIVLASATEYDKCPGEGRTDGPFTFIGDSTAPNKVKVPGAELVGQRILLNGFRFTSELGEDEYTHAGGNHIRNSVLVRGARLGSAYGAPGVRVEACRIGTDSSSARLMINPPFALDRPVIKNNVIRLRSPNAADEQTILSIKSDRLQYDDAGGPAPITYLQFTGNNIRLPRLENQSTNIKITFLGGMRHAYFADNKWVFVDSSNVGSGTTTCQAYLWRDGNFNNLVLRDTVEATTAFAGRGNLGFYFRSSGHSYDGANNTWRWCVFKNMTPTTVFARYQGAMNSGDSLSHCVFACSTGLGNSAPTVEGVGLGGGTIYRCTFINKGGGGAFATDPYQGELRGSLKVSSCIFYAGPTVSNISGMGASWIFPTNTYKLAPSRYTTGPRIFSDYNLYYTGNLRDDYAVAWNAFGSGPSYGNVGASKICDDFDNECHSRWGDPGFTAASVSGFNPRISVTSAARGNGEGGVDCGAYDYSDMTDITAPATIVLDGYSREPHNVVLAWLAPGDDASTGTAHHYDIRYSTSTITGGGFGSETEWTSLVPAPAVAGTMQSVTVSGLTNNTNYYFAIKAYDEAGNASAISNVLLVRPVDTQVIED